MVRGQEQMDMSAIDKSLDEIIEENKRAHGRGRSNRSSRGRGRGRGRSRGRGSFNRQRSMRNRGNGRRSRANRFYNNTRFMKRRGRGSGRMNAPSNRYRFGQKPLHRSGTNNSFTTQGKVVVTNLKKHVSSDDIKEIFEKFGTVTQAFVKFDANNGASLGIAEVYYSRGAEARQAQKELDGAKIDNGIIRVRLAIPSNFQPKRGGFRGRGRGGRGRSGGGRGGFGIRRSNKGFGRGGGRRRARNNNNNPLQR